MNHRRTVVVLSSLLVASALVTSTVGLSSITATRDTEVAVVDDDAAYLGFEQRPWNARNGTTNLTVTVTNRFPSDTYLTDVRVSVGGRTVDIAADDPLGPGDGATTGFYLVDCGERIRVEASGSGVSVRFHRRVDCEHPAVNPGGAVPERAERQRDGNGSDPPTERPAVGGVVPTGPAETARAG